MAPEDRELRRYLEGHSVEDDANGMLLADKESEHTTPCAAVLLEDPRGNPEELPERIFLGGRFAAWDVAGPSLLLGVGH
jgi:hypothetical protein